MKENRKERTQISPERKNILSGFCVEWWKKILFKNSKRADRLNEIWKVENVVERKNIASECGKLIERQDQISAPTCVALYDWVAKMTLATSENLGWF